jgi:flagellar motor switch protein FliN
MTERLSQDEIDALLNMGLGGSDPLDDVEAEPEPDAFAMSAPQMEQQPFAAPPDMSQAWESPQPSLPQQPMRKMRPSPKIENPVDVQKATFQDFDDDDEPSPETTNLETILNLKLELRVELGTTLTTVREVLEMGPGSVLELQKLNGEPVDLRVNLKPFSKGEMIVIGENFGVRVTDILSVTEIIEALK